MDRVSKSMNTVAKSAGVILLSTGAGMAFAFGGRVLMARLYPQSEYGIFSLAWVVLNFAALFSLLGIQESVARQIAYKKDQGDERGIRSIIRHSLALNIAVSVVISLALYLTAGPLAMLLDEPELATAVRIFALAVPFLALTLLLASIFRGLGRMLPKVLFFDLSRNGLFLLFLIPVILLGLSFSIAMWLFAGSIIATGVVFCIYTAAKYKKRVPSVRTGENSSAISLLAFSLPVFALIVVSITISWTDTFMLGIYESALTVGLYNSAWPTAQLIILVLNAVAFMYVPMASQLHSQGLTEELKRSYTVMAKWIFAATLPLLLLFMFFPSNILGMLYGSEYTAAATALRLLALAFFAHILFGPSNVALLVVGKPMAMLWVSLTCAVINIGLNAMLIPVWGLNGAAAASLISFTTLYVLLAVMLYRKSGLHTFKGRYLKPMVLMAVILPVLFWSSQKIVAESWMLPLYFILFIGVYVMSLVLTTSVGREDIYLFRSILRLREADA